MEQRYLCQQCGVVVETDAEWEAHQRSAEHEALLQRHREQEGDGPDDPSEVLGL